MKAVVGCAAVAALLMSGCCCAPCATDCGPSTMLPHLVEKTKCASGCGEIYLGEWYADPPACDPCDRCGNYVGHGGYCGPTWRELWGIRYEGNCGPRCGGCSSCGHDSGVVYDDSYGEMDGEIIYDAPGEGYYGPQTTPTPADPQPPMPSPDDSEIEGLPPSVGPESTQGTILPNGGMQTYQRQRVYPSQRTYQAQRSSSPFVRRRR